MDRIGRYKIVKELGRGAMGVVYHAIDPNIGRPVAIKTIRLGDMQSDEERARLRERLSREARSAGILSHPGIVTIYDVDQQGDMAFIAMEFVDGPTLDEVLSAPQPITAERMFSVISQTAVALDYAHQKGIVHRDIKPANIMIARDGTVKITDFGIAKITRSDQLTMTGAIVGTPHYMSPEQVQGHAVDGRSDQFSLAVMTYEMLTGEKPFSGEHLTTVVYKIVADEPPLAGRLNPSLGQPIETVLRRGLAKKPGARYGTCQEFVGALEKACATVKGWKPMARGGTLNVPTVADVPAPAVKLPPPRRRRAGATTTENLSAKRRVGFLPVFLGILMAAGLVALIAWQAAPWLQQQEEAVRSKPAPAPAPAPQPAPTPQPAPAPEDQRPSPLGEPAPPAEEPPRPARKAQPPAPVAVPVAVATDPPGATVSLESGESCTSPCTLQAPPGRHSVSVSLGGYQTERREIVTGNHPQELPLITLRAPGGTLMLSTEPRGATIQIDGKAMPQTTPAQIPLAPGRHTVTVQINGKTASRTVEVQNGAINYQRITIE